MDIDNKKLTPDDTLTKFFNAAVTSVLSEYFDVKCCKKGHDWYTPWEGHFRKSFSLYASKGYLYPILWGYNADFIPTRQNSGRYIYHRTENAVAIHICDSFYDHVPYSTETMDCSQTYQIRQEYCLSKYIFDDMGITDVGSAYRYISDITRRNVPFMLEFFERVRTVDDMITYIDSQMKHDDLFSWNLNFYKAFLLAYKRQMNEAIRTLEILYPHEIPEDLFKKLQSVCELEQ